MWVGGCVLCSLPVFQPKTAKHYRRFGATSLSPRKERDLIEARPLAVRAGAYVHHLQQRGWMKMLDSLPKELRDRVLDLGGITSHQSALLEDAYRRNPSQFARAVGGAGSARSPGAYLVGAARSICTEDLARRAAPVPQRRHDLDPVACRDCGDTGFVVLTRTVGLNAQAGDAAPCHCDTGQQKQSRYGTVHYAIGDFEPAVPDPTVQLMSFQEYAASEAGKRDPHLQEILRTGSSTMRSLPAELAKPISTSIDL